MAVASGDQRRRLDAIESLVGEITSTQLDWNSDCIPLAIRNALERGWSQSFSVALEDGKKKKELAVDRICAKHYGDFLKSVKELITMRSSAAELKTVVKEMSEEFHSTGNDLITVLLELEKSQKDVEKTKKVAESLRVCKEVSTFMCLAVDQIESGQQYAAMHTIQILQNELKDNISVKPLVAKLESWLPVVIDRLLEGCKREAETFLAFSLNSSLLVGQTILRRRAASLLSGHSNRAEESVRNRSTADSHFVSLMKKQKINRVIKGSDDEEKEGSWTSHSMQYVESRGELFHLQSWMVEGDLVNIIPENFLQIPCKNGITVTDSISTELGALHKCLHMHVILGRSETFSADYRALRLPVISGYFSRADSAVKQHQPLTTVIPQLLANLTGFFLFENIFKHCAVHKTGPFSNAELSALWETSCTSLDQFLSRHLPSLTSPEEALLLKEDILLFAESTADAIFHSRGAGNERERERDGNKVLSVLNTVWISFEKLQVNAATARCKLALDNCQYQSLYVSTELQYLTLIKAFHIENLSEEDSGVVSNVGGTLGYGPGTDSGISTPTLGSSSGGNLKNMSDSGANKELTNSLFYIHAESVNKTNNSNNSNSVPASDGKGTSIAEKKIGATRPLSLHSATAALDALEEDLDYTVSSRPLSPPSSTPTSTSVGKGQTSDISGFSDEIVRKGKIFVPITYPFSSAVPGILKQLYLLVLRFYVFAVKNPVLPVKGEALCTAVMKVFRFLNTYFKEELEKGGDRTPLSKACQISIDASALAQASSSIWHLVEGVLTQLKWGGAVCSHLPAASSAGRGGLMKISLQAQDLVFELLSDKVTDLLDSSLMFIEYEPQTLPKTPHEMITQLCDFLSSTFMWLSHLPSAAREAAHFTCCSRVSSGILQYILSPRVERINALCIIGLDLDARKLELFADSCGIAHLRQCFAEVKEIVRASLHPDLQQMADNVNLRKSLFPRLDPLRLAALLEKVTPTPLSAVSNTSNLPLMDKKFLQTVVKKLKAQSKA